MGAEPGRPNELLPITRIDTAARPVQSAAGRSFIEPGWPWQNPFVESFGSRVRDEVLSVETFDSVLKAQTVITDWRTIYTHRRRHSSLGWRPPAAYAASLPTNKSEKPARLSVAAGPTNGAGQIRRRNRSWARPDAHRGAVCPQRIPNASARMFASACAFACRRSSSESSIRDEPDHLHRMRSTASCAAHV
jgi:hypothetical protein